MASRSTFDRADVGYFLALSSVWGFSFLFIKVAVGAVSPLWVVAARTVVGGAILYAIVRLRGRRLDVDRTLWFHLSVIAIIGNLVPWTMVAWAEESIPSGLAAVINSFVPAATLVVAALAGIERLTGRKIAGLSLALLGTGLVLSGEVGSPERLTAVLVAVAATLLFAVAGVYTKGKVSGRATPLVIAAVQVLVAAVIAVPAAIVVGPIPSFGDLGLNVWASLTLLGIFGTGVAFFLFFTLIERVGPTNAAMVTYVIPVIGLLVGWLVLGERFGLHILGGAAIIVCGIWLAQRERVAAVEAEEREPIAA